MSSYRHPVRYRRVREGSPRKLLVILLGVITPAALIGIGALAASARTFNPGRRPRPPVTTSASPSAAAPAANPNMDCTLIVPANPLTAAGLATPWQLTATNAAAGACHESNVGAQSAFVQGAIITPAGAIQIYNPVVVDQGTQPAVAPTAPTIAAGSTVALWIGFNGNNLTLRGTGNSLAQGRCVNGLQGSIFGQVSYCNAPAFFQAANRAIAAGTLKVPALGTATDGKTCPTMRDFSVVDQDQEDNVNTTYLVTANGTIAQNTAANRAKLAGSSTIGNGSDNALLASHIDPALGCTPFMAPDVADGNTMTTAVPLNELSAAANQAAPIALVPPDDPMVLVNGAPNTTKVNLYRAGVDERPVNAQTDTAAAYCANLFGANGAGRVFADQAITAKAASLVPAAASNLFTFLAMRLNQSFTNLGCTGTNPVALTMTNGIVTAATLNATAAAGAGASAAPSASGAVPAPSTSVSAAPAPRPWWWHRRGDIAPPMSPAPAASATP